MIYEAVSIIFGRMLDFLPTFILRWFFDPNKVGQKVEISLSSEHPGRINLGSHSPAIDIWFEILNLSNFDIELDRLLVDIWISQPIVEGAYLKRQLVKRASKASKLYFSTRHLSRSHIGWITERVDAQHLAEPLTIYFHAFFETKLGRFEKKGTLEKRDIPVS